MIYKDSICEGCLAHNPELREVVSSEDTKEEEIYCVYCINNRKPAGNAVCLYLGKEQINIQ